MSEETSLRIEKLSRQLTVLRNQRNSLNEEARSWADKRDGIHKRIKDLRLEAATIRERRDETNAKVRALKTQRDLTRAQKKEKIEEIKQLKDKLRILIPTQPKRALGPLKTEIDEIEWTIQTTSLTLEEEKPLVKRANELRKEYDRYERMADLRSRVLELERSMKTRDEEAEILHKQLTKLAFESQQFHDRMIEILEKAKALKIQADEYHQNSVSTRSKSQVLHEECVELETKVKTLKGSLKEITEKSRLEQQSEKRKKLEEEAARKMKEGGKLSFEEFKLLIEKEKN